MSRNPFENQQKQHKTTQKIAHRFIIQLAKEQSTHQHPDRNSLISYGRSSLIVTMIAIGMLLRIHHELAVDAAAPNRRRQTKPAAGRRQRK